MTLNNPNEDPFSLLERSFHEPKRLAIVSALLSHVEGPLTFSELKEHCDLTDGNLNRHLKVLEEASVVCVEKSKGTGRPVTYIQLTDTGRRDFIRYLENLESVLKKAALAARKADRHAAGSALSGLPRARARA